MSYPAGWDLVNVTGTYIAKDGVPCIGSVTFSSPQMVLRSGTIVPAADIVFTLDGSGAFSGQVPATDDPNATPSGWLYTVTENVPGGRSGFLISAPHTSPGIDLSTVVPVVFPVPPATQYPLVTLQQLAGTNPGQGIQLVGFPAGSSPNQASTGNFFSGNGAGIWRVNDRVFIAGATASDGAYPPVQNSWVGSFYDANGYTNYAEPGMLSVSTVPSGQASGFPIAIFGGAQAIGAGLNAAAIGLFGLGVNNNTSHAAFAWGAYFEAQQVTTTGGTAYGVEASVRSTSPAVTLTPYNTPPDGMTIGLQLDAGAGVSATGQYNATAALNISSNPMAFNSGIVFRSGSLAMTSSVADAIALPQDYAIDWYTPSGLLGPRIYSSVTTNTSGQSISFNDGFLGVYSQAGSPLLLVMASNTYVNAAALQGSVAGNPVSYAVTGADTNIDIALEPKGTGVVWLGAYAATPPSATGYITVKDSTGTVRKLLCA